MDQLTRYYRHRVLSNASEFLQGNDEYYLVCVNKAVLNLIRVLLEGYGKRINTYYTEETEAGYFTPTREQYDVIEDFIDEFIGDTNVTCQDITSAIEGMLVELQGIKEAIVSNGRQGINCGNCNGSGGSGLTSQPASAFQDSGSNYPSGYTDRSSYLDTKCNLAYYLVSLWIKDFQSIRQVNVATISLEAAVAMLTLSFLTPVPFDDILAIAGVILALVSIGVSAYVEAVDEMIAYLQAMDVCLLYEAASAETAINNIYTDIDGQAFTQATLVKNFLKYFIGYDSVNKLFGPMPTDINLDALPQGDCSACGEPGQLEFVFGSGDLTIDGEVRTLTSSSDGNNQRIDIRVVPGTTCFDWTMTFEENFEMPNATFLQRCDATVIYNGVNQQVLSGAEWTGYYMRLEKAGSQFSINVRISA